MLNTIIGSIIGNADISIIQFIVPILSALILGFILAKASMGDNGSSKGFIVTLALLPAIVCVVIMAVNGNVPCRFIMCCPPLGCFENTV